jgi:hypothetical protein
MSTANKLTQYDLEFTCEPKHWVQLCLDVEVDQEPPVQWSAKVRPMPDSRKREAQRIIAKILGPGSADSSVEVSTRRTGGPRLHSITGF